MVLVAPERADCGAVSTLDEDVYRTAVVRAFDPAEAEDEVEKEFTAPAPVAPFEEFAWMKSALRLPGF